MRALFAAIAVIFFAAEDAAAPHLQPTSFHVKTPALPAPHFNQAFGWCGEPCVLPMSTGGELDKFVAAAKEVLRGYRKRIIIDTHCGSSCAVFADMVHEKACITPRAVFGFHQLARITPMYADDLRLIHVEFVGPPPIRPELNQWVMDKTKGHYPQAGRIEMGARTASKFWKVCDPEMNGYPHR